jgi:hypothetical protein
LHPDRPHRPGRLAAAGGLNACAVIPITPSSELAASWSLPSLHRPAHRCPSLIRRAGSTAAPSGHPCLTPARSACAARKRYSEAASLNHAARTGDAALALLWVPLMSGRRSLETMQREQQNHRTADPATRSVR